MKKVIISAAVVTGVFVLVGCSSFDRSMKQQSESRFVDEFCDTDNMVPQDTRVKVLIDLKREELASAKGELEAGLYQKLSQELAGYSVEWEILNKRDQQACKIRALCLYREKTTGECENSEENYRAAQNRADQFMLELRKFTAAK